MTNDLSFRTYTDNTERNYKGIYKHSNHFNGILSFRDYKVYLGCTYHASKGKHIVFVLSVRQSIRKL